MPANANNFITNCHCHMKRLHRINYSFHNRKYEFTSFFISFIAIKKLLNESKRMETIDTSLQLNTDELRKGKMILRAINHPLRQQMLQLIHKNEKMIVTDLYHELKLEQSVASQHLAILRNAGFVDTIRNAKFIFYSVNHDRLHQVHQICNELTGK